MDTIASSEFRKRYASLTEPTTVTVNGHVIGEWVPVTHSRYLTVQEMREQVAGVRRDAEKVMAERYDQRPVAAVPKGRQRRSGPNV